MPPPLKPAWGWGDGSGLFRGSGGRGGKGGKGGKRECLFKAGEGHNPTHPGKGHGQPQQDPEAQGDSQRVAREGALSLACRLP